MKKLLNKIFKKEEPKPKYPNLKWNEVAGVIIEKLDKESMLAIARMKSVDEMHGGMFFGMGIRNGYFLWHEDNPLVKSFNEELGVYHADDMSGIIIEHIWNTIHGVTRYDPIPTVNRYREHWGAYGCNMKGEKLENQPYKTIDQGEIHKWKCKSCGSPVLLDVSGNGRCKCTKSPSPWEQV